MEGLQLTYDSRGLYLWLGLLLAVIVLLAWVALLQGRLNRAVGHYRRLTRGVSGATFDDVLENHLNDLEETTERLRELTAQCARIEAGVSSCLQRVGVVRFNPFSDVGGDQSFSVALLDASGDGLVISSLYGRRESRVYVKSVERGTSKHALSEEEEEAIQRAETKRPRQHVR